jgi:nucleotide-binding universal stress UspA family protein
MRMPFVKILAPLTGGRQDESLLANAFAAAKPFGAHVVGLFVRPDPAQGLPFYGDGASSLVVQEVMEAANEAGDIAAQSAKDALAKAAAAAGIPILAAMEKRQTATASFQEVQGNFADCVTRAARLSDFVVFGTLKEIERVGVTEAFEATLIEAGRPALLAGPAMTADFCDKVAIGWNDSLACAHAVAAALPFLARARTVEILTVRRNGEEAVPTGELKDYLMLHGVSAGERSVDAGPRAVGEVLLDSAAQSGAGLLVLGGYGHSRLREIFVSGVTKQVIAHADLPLFLVH